MDVQEIHTRAMELADQGDLLRRQGNADDALCLIGSDCKRDQRRRNVYILK